MTDEIWLRIIQAAATALLAGALVFLFQNYIQERMSSRRAEREMRRELLHRASAIHGAFYLATQHTWRRLSNPPVPQAVIDELDAAYLDLANAGYGLEQELGWLVW